MEWNPSSLIEVLIFIGTSPTIPHNHTKCRSELYQNVILESVQPVLLLTLNINSNSL